MWKKEICTYWHREYWHVLIMDTDLFWTWSREIENKTLVFRHLNIWTSVAWKQFCKLHGQITKMCSEYKMHKKIHVRVKEDSVANMCRISLLSTCYKLCLASSLCVFTSSIWLTLWCICVIHTYIRIYIFIYINRRKKKWNKKISHSYKSVFVYSFLNNLTILEFYYLTYINIFA